MGVEKELKKEAFLFGLELFEENLASYSFMIRLLDALREEDGVFKKGPKIFVEEVGFDFCKVFLFDEVKIRENAYSIDPEFKDIVSIEKIRPFFERGNFPVELSGLFNFSISYLFPLKEDLEKKGIIFLGSKGEKREESGKRSLRETEVLVEVFSKCLSLEERLTGKKQNIYLEVLNILPFALLLADKKGRICFFNKKAEEAFLKKGSLLNEYIYHLFPCITENIYQDDKVYSLEISYHEGQHYKRYHLEALPFREWKLFLIFDLAQERIVEEKEMQRQKIESIGLLAGGVAHDFNNILTGILGYSSLLKNALKGDEKLFKFAEIIESSAARGAKLTQQLLNFYRRRKRVFGPVNINVLIEDVLFLLRETLKEIEIVKELDEYIPPIRGDEAGLQQVFLNLCLNAKQAMEDKGTLKIKTGIKKYLRGREFVYVSVEDTGKGMDEETKKYIFEPFFTTKERETGLGLGLYLVKGIVKEHNGFIEVESEKGKGTKFCIYFPVEVVKEGEGEKNTSENREKMEGRGKNVLVVDDETVVRELLKDILTSEGLNVFEAKDGKEALEFFEKEAEKIDLVILDFLMPGPKGDEIMLKMKDKRAEVKIIISSGFMSEEFRKKLKMLGADGFLDKPYKEQEIKKAVSFLLKS